MDGHTIARQDSPLLPSNTDQDQESQAQESQAQESPAWPKPLMVRKVSPPRVPVQSALRPRADAFPYPNASEGNASPSTATTTQFERPIAYRTTLRMKQNRFGEVFYEDAQIASADEHYCDACASAAIGCAADACRLCRRPQAFTIVCLIGAGVLLGWLIAALPFHFLRNPFGDKQV